MTVPVISVFKNSYPNTKITILTTKFFSELFNQIPDINFFFFKENHKNIFGLFLLKREIIKLEVDYIIDLHNVLRTKVLNFLFKLSFKKVQSIDKGRADRKKLTRKKNYITYSKYWGLSLAKKITKKKKLI